MKLNLVVKNLASNTGNNKQKEIPTSNLVRDQYKNFFSHNLKPKKKIKNKELKKVLLRNRYIIKSLFISYFNEKVKKIITVLSKLCIKKVVALYFFSRK